MKKLLLIIVTLLSLNGYSQITYTDLEKELFKIFNEYRISIGEDSSIYDKVDSDKCRIHSTEMKKNKSLYHSGVGGEICMISHFKFNYFEYHTTQSLAKHILDLFLTSTKGHKEIIEDFSTSIAVGVSIDYPNDDVYITIRFGYLGY